MLADLHQTKSTNVRTKRRPSPLPPVRAGLRALTVLSPRLTAGVAQQVFSMPRRHARPEREARLLATGRPFKVIWRDRLLHAWQWGAPSGPTALLVHGWEGRGAQLGAFAESLVDVGFRVVAFDAPAHGDTPGRTLTPVDFASAIDAVASWVGGVDAVIAHSMGAIATAIAMHRGVAVARAAFVAPAVSPGPATQALARVLDLPPSVLDLVQNRIANLVGRDWASIERGVIMEGHDVPLLVHHDRDDADVPVEAAIQLCELWTPSELKLTEGLGHRRILWDGRVVASVTSFLAPLCAVRPAERDPWRAFIQMDPTRA